MAIFHLVVNEIEFSVPFERQKNHWNLRILYFMRHFTDTINDIMKLGTRDRDDNLKLERRPWEKYHFWTKSYYVTSVGNDVINPLIFLDVNAASYVNMILTNIFGRKDRALTKKEDSFPLIPVRNLPWYYVLVLWVFYSFNFQNMWCPFKGPCDVKSFKISTAYDV